MSEDELAFMRRFKTGEAEVPQGRDVMSQGQKSPILQTVLSGMAVRSILLGLAGQDNIQAALSAYVAEVKAVTFPGLEHGFSA